MPGAAGDIDSPDGGLLSRLRPRCDDPHPNLIALPLAGNPTGYLMRHTGAIAIDHGIASVAMQRGIVPPRAVRRAIPVAKRDRKTADSTQITTPDAPARLIAPIVMATKLHLAPHQHPCEHSIPITNRHIVQRHQALQNQPKTSLPVAV